MQDSQTIVYARLLKVSREISREEADGGGRRQGGSDESLEVDCTNHLYTVHAAAKSSIMLLSHTRCSQTGNNLVLCAVGCTQPLLAITVLLHKNSLF